MCPTDKAECLSASSPHGDVTLIVTEVGLLPAPVLDGLLKVSSHLPLGWEDAEIVQNRMKSLWVVAQRKWSFPSPTLWVPAPLGTAGEEQMDGLL